MNDIEVWVQKVFANKFTWYVCLHDEQQHYRIFNRVSIAETFTFHFYIPNVCVALLQLSLTSPCQLVDFYCYHWGNEVTDGSNSKWKFSQQLLMKMFIEERTTQFWFADHMVGVFITRVSSQDSLKPESPILCFATIHLFRSHSCCSSLASWHTADHCWSLPADLFHLPQSPSSICLFNETKARKTL